MKLQTTALGIVIALLGILAIPSAGAQADVLVSAEANATATDVVNGSVIGTQFVDTGLEVHTLAMIQVETTLRGELADQVFVEVPGGRSNLGYDVFVSHQPYFRLGDRVQLALTPTPIDEASSLAEGVPVYSVVHGMGGTAGLDGDLVISQADAAGDYTLHGAKFGSFPQTFRVNTASSGVSSSATIDAVKAAFQEWEDDPGSDIDFTYGGTTGAVATSYSDGQNTLSWVTTSNPADGYLAQAVWVASGSTIVGFDIAFNRDYQFSSGAVGGKFDITTVALHEAGHTLGLGHTTASTAEVMYPSVTSGQAKHLGAGDRSGAASLYPAAFSTATCNGLTPTINMNTNGGNGIGTAGNDIILGTDGDDRIYGLGGNDVICAGPGDDLANGGAGDDILWGGTGADRLVGDANDDVVYGEDGNDLLWGNGGADDLYGGPGNDYLTDKAGNDYLAGGVGDDFLNAGEGNDVMDGGDGLDRMWGFGGADSMSGGNGNDRLFGMDGNDTMTGNADNDIMNGGSGNDDMHGGPGNDLMWGIDGADTLRGDSGVDTINGGGVGPNYLYGGDGNDSIVGGSGTDRVWAGEGLDRVWGGSGNDILYGQGGNDRLFGQAGNDGCHGDSGTDISTGCESTTSIP